MHIKKLGAAILLTTPLLFLASCIQEVGNAAKNVGSTVTKPVHAIGSAGGGHVKGIDVSDNVGTVNWSQVKEDGYAFAFVKATDGVSYPTGYFNSNWPAMKEAGILRGAYHYFEPNDDPKDQAEFFIKTVGKLDSNDLPPVLDFEKAGGLSPSQMTAAAKTWLETVERAMGVRPMIYCSQSFANEYIIDDSLSKYPLWIAEYGVSAPRPTNVWGNNWTIWQYSQSGTVDGVPGGADQTDLDVFNGSLNSLKAFIRQSH